MGEPDQAPAVGLSDLTMMVMTGGMERTLPEWRALAATFPRGVDPGSCDLSDHRCRAETALIVGIGGLELRSRTIAA